MEFLGKLGIDLKLLIAQIINFLVLLWLLQYFLYKPLIKKLKERAEKAREIEKGKKEIQKRKEEIEKREEEIIQKAKQKTRQIIEEGKEISKKEKERILSRAEEEMREILKQAREKAKIEIERARAQQTENILEKTKRILKKILSRSFSRELHRKYIREVIKDLEKVDFGKIREKEIIQVTVTSAFPLRKEEEKEISNFLFKKLKNPAFQQKVDPRLISGIKVQINGFLIDGSLKEKIEKEI